MVCRGTKIYCTSDSEYLYPYEEMHDVWARCVLSSHFLCLCDALGIACVHVRPKFP